MRSHLTVYFSTFEFVGIFLDWKIIKPISVLYRVVYHFLGLIMQSKSMQANVLYICKERFSGLQNKEIKKSFRLSGDLGEDLVL